MTEQQIKKEYGKSIWQMSVSEIIENNLVNEWVLYVDGNIRRI